MAENFIKNNNSERLENNQTKEKKLVESKKGYKKFLIYFLLFIFAYWFSRNVYGIIPVVGQSMEKTFYNGDICIARMKDENINRYDVIIADIGTQNVIKRVIGLPGDKVYIYNGNVYVNEFLIDEKYNYPTENPSGENEIYEVSDDEYFVLGDNRNNSADSRHFGCIKKEQVLGEVVLRVYPFNNIGSNF